MTWTPTAENINALEPGLREYIHRLETFTGSAGEVRRRVLAEQRVLELARLVEEAQEYPEAAEVCGEAYQVVGCLLDALGIFDTPEAEKILDNLSQHRLVHKDVLPWTRTGPDEGVD